MKIMLVLFCLALVTTASAADAPASSPQPQPLAPSAGLKSAQGVSAAKLGVMHRVLSPAISETSVTRQADGSLAMNCVQKPNPKIGKLPAHAMQSVEPQQP